MENKIRFFNIIDVAIILVLIAIIGGAVFRTYMDDFFLTNSKNVTIEYVLEIESTEKEFRRLINNGDFLYSNNSSSSCGVVVSCEKNPSKTYVKGQEDELIIKYNPEKIDIFLTVNSIAQKSDSGYIIEGNNYIGVGLSSQFRTDMFIFDAKVISIREISPDNIG